MQVVWLGIAGFVLAIAFFDRKRLIQRESREVIFIISFALFAGAVFVPIFTLGEPVLFPSLMNPLVSLGLFLVMRKLFVRWKKREPLDTFNNWRRGLAADRLFNILYFSLGTLLMGLLWFSASLTGYRWY